MELDPTKSDESFIKLCLEQASSAAAVGEVPVGAVVVSADGEVVATGMNTREADQDPLGHAEIVAIRKASESLSSWRLEGCTLYVTLEPCLMCAGAIFSSRIERVVFGAFDPKAGAFGSIFDLSSEDRLNHSVSVTSGVLANECGEILTDFFAELRKKP